MLDAFSHLVKFGDAFLFQPPTTFLGRLELIAAGRKLTPWLTAIGWSKTDAHRVLKGHVPGTAKLLLLAKAEQVNLHWLLTGDGEISAPKAWQGVREPPPPPNYVAGPRGELVSLLGELPDPAVKALVTLARQLAKP